MKNSKTGPDRKKSKKFGGASPAPILVSSGGSPWHNSSSAREGEAELRGGYGVQEASLEVLSSGGGDDWLLGPRGTAVHPRALPEAVLTLWRGAGGRGEAAVAPHEQCCGQRCGADAAEGAQCRTARERRSPGRPGAE